MILFVHGLTFTLVRTLTHCRSAEKILHEHHNLNSLPNILKAIKSRNMWHSDHNTGRDRICMQNVGWKIWRQEITWKI